MTPASPQRTQGQQAARNVSASNLFMSRGHRLLQAGTRAARGKSNSKWYTEPPYLLRSFYNIHTGVPRDGNA